MTALSLDRTALDMRRGACPALSAPMMTGDGLLARTALTDAISPAALAHICRLAVEHGNGMIDISARGNLQVRGLSDGSAPRLDSDMRALDLPLRDGLAVEVPPLAGLDPGEIADPRPLADAIRRGAAGITGLAPKMAVIVDGAGQLQLSDLLADIRLVATGNGEWKLLLGGTAHSGCVSSVLRETHAVDTVLGLLKELATLGGKARGRDLAVDQGLRKTMEQTAWSDPSQETAGIDNMVAGRTLAADPGTAARNTARSPFDIFKLSNGRHAVGIGAASGQAQAGDLIALCDEAMRLGIASARPALDHSLLFFGAEAACRALQDFAGRHGFIVSPGDTRSHIAACTGSPACNSATIETHSIALRAAAECGDLLDGSFKLHIAGCPKGCAHPQSSALALCGTAAGVSLIAGGKAAGEPFAFADFADTNATLRRLSDFVNSERQPGENSAACLARIGSARLAAAATGRP